MQHFRDFVQHKLSQASTPGLGQEVSPATNLLIRTHSYFYSPQNGQYQARVKSESTLGENDHFGYVVWPVTIMVHAAAECLSGQKLQESIACLQAYWNPERHGFCAWKMFPGNEDIYYDDNAHAAQALISAFQTTRDHRFLSQAKAILMDLILPSSLKDGGIPWHINNQNCRNACSTGPAAIAALRICLLEHDQTLATFAQRTLTWLIQNLRDPQDGLIWDSLIYEDNGTVTINKMKWTYNTGFAIHGFTLLYDLNKSPEDLGIAVSLANAAINPEGPLFDHSIPNPGLRMYSDSSFFLHHLVDGYFALSRHAMTERLRNEIRKVALFGRRFMLDSSDGLYFRGSCPYTISEEKVQEFNAAFNLQKGLEPNPQERDEQGKLCKTLIGNAGWARIFGIFSLADN